METWKSLGPLPLLDLLKTHAARLAEVRGAYARSRPAVGLLLRAVGRRARLLPARRRGSGPEDLAVEADHAVADLHESRAAGRHPSHHAAVHENVATHHRSGYA